MRSSRWMRRYKRGRRRHRQRHTTHAILISSASIMLRKVRGRLVYSNNQLDATVRDQRFSQPHNQPRKAISHSFSLGLVLFPPTLCVYCVGLAGVSVERRMISRNTASPRSDRFISLHYAVFMSLKWPCGVIFTLPLILLFPLSSYCSFFHVPVFYCVSIL